MVEPLSIKSILVPLDGSDYSNKALRYAIDLAKKYDAKLTLVHVVVSPLYAYSEGFLLTEHEKRLEEEGEEILSKGKEEVEREGLTVDTKLLKGHPSEEIYKLANEQGYGMVVIGSRGLSGIKAFLLGSVSERVARFAKCPVLIVKM